MQCEEIIMHGMSVSGEGVLWFTATCEEYYIWKMLVRVHVGYVFV